MLSPMYRKIHKLANWVFDEPTRPVELLSATIGFWFASIMLLNSTMTQSHISYTPFVLLEGGWIWILIVFLSVIHFIKIFAKSTKLTPHIRSYILLWFALVYILIAILFAAAWPPLTTGFPTYCTLAIINLLAHFKIDGDERIICAKNKRASNIKQCKESQGHD